MANHTKLKTQDALDTNELTEQWMETTGQTVGTRRAVHTYPLTGDPTADLVQLALLGDQPEPNFDSVTKSSPATGQYNYTFSLSSVRQFTVEVTGVGTEFPTAGAVQEQALALEQSPADQILLESGDELLKETP